MSRRLTVLGVGNPLAGDDGVGVRVVELLRNVALPEYVEVYDAGVDGLAWFDLLTDPDREVWIVDAVRMEGVAPGTLRVVENAEAAVRVGGPIISGHDLTIAHALRLAQALGQLLARVRLYGIAVDPTATRPAMSMEVAGAIEPLVRLLLREMGAHTVEPACHAGEE